MEVSTMFCFPIYPRGDLDGLKKGGKVRQQLSNAILQVLTTDPAVQDLVRAKIERDAVFQIAISNATLQVLQNDPEVQDLVRQKTDAVFQGLKGP
jgi:hypothetical protein